MTPEYFQFSAHGPAIRLLFRSRSLLTTDSIDAVVVVVHFADLISIVKCIVLSCDPLRSYTAFNCDVLDERQVNEKSTKKFDVARYES